MHSIHRDRLRQRAYQVWLLHRAFNGTTQLLLSSGGACLMCGIAGFFNSRGSSDSYPATLVEMLQRIDYRGPDEMGYYFDEHAAIGSVRLSIIDLATGQQPFLDETQRYALVYNGELYN